MFDSGVPSLADWKRKSSAGWLRGRSNPALLAVDTKVGAYETLNGRGSPGLQDRYEALVEILEAVEVYLASKGGVHCERRDVAARALKAIVIKELSRVRWQKIRDLQDPRGGKMMTPGVWSEFHDKAHTRTGIETDAWFRDPTEPERFLFQFLRRARQQGTPTDSVVYIEDDNRWRYLVAFDSDGRLWRRGTDMEGRVVVESRPADTQDTSTRTRIYAMDLDGNLYAELSGGSLNHCSFLGGRAVLCAGEVGVTRGALDYIDTGSGHYRPRVQDLLKALEALQQKRVRLSGVLVRRFDAKWNDAVYDAAAFLLQRGRSRPVGYVPAGRTYQEAVRFRTPQEFAEWARAKDGIAAASA